MATLIGQLIRNVYRREQIPARARWWLAAAGMRDWFRVLSSQLRPQLGEEARPILARHGAELFRRRYEALRVARPALPDAAAVPRAPALLMAALYGIEWRRTPRAAWIFAAVGGPPSGMSERWQARRLLARLSVEERWAEVATHLGELLIVLTDGLPADLPHARRVLGDLCFQAGARYAERMVRLLGLPVHPKNAPAQAIEILRMSEYIFQVNPRHWGETDEAAGTGWLEGTACPWYTRPGWTGGHCGIFGQFQSGISSVFGLRYHLSRTIPKHGGDTCRIDLKPIPIRLRKET